MSAWGVKRRLSYLVIVLFFFSIIFFSFYLGFFRRPASCSDNIKNQDEINIDCGGTCKRVCLAEISPLRKNWVRFFKTGDGKYDVAALIENPNYNLGLESLDYTFKLYDADKFFITEKVGQTFVNSRDKFVIFEGSLDTGKRIPVKAIIDFVTPMTWSRIDPKKSRSPVNTQNKELMEGQTPRLSAEIINSSTLDLDGISITAVVYDEDDNAIAVSQTFVDYLKRGGVWKIFFTWPKPFATSHPTTQIYPRVDLVE